MQHEFKIARIRVFMALLGIMVMAGCAIWVLFEVESAALNIFAALIAGSAGFLIPRQFALLFSRDPLLTTNKSFIFHKGLMVDPIPWSRIDGIYVPDDRNSRCLELIVEDLKSSERRGQRYFSRILHRESYLPETFEIRISMLQGTMVDVLRACAETGGLVGRRALAQYLSGPGKKYARAGEAESLLNQLETEVRSVEEGVGLVWTLLGTDIPLDVSRLERVFDVAIQWDADHVREKLKYGAAFNLIFLDVGRKRLEAGGHDVSGLPIVSPSELKAAEERKRIGHPPVPPFTRMIAVAKAALFLLIGLAAVVTMFSGVIDPNEDWQEFLIAIGVAGLMFWGFSLDLKVALGIARRGTGRY